MDRADLGLIVLCVPGDSEEFDGFSYEDELPRGIVRYFDVRVDPPRRGRPVVSTTLDLEGVVNLIAAKFSPEAGEVEWVSPEPDP